MGGLKSSDVGSLEAFSKQVVIKAQNPIFAMRLAKSRYANVSPSVVMPHMQKARGRLSHGPFQDVFDGLMRRLRLSLL